VREAAHFLEKSGHIVEERAPGIDPNLPKALRTIVAANTDLMLRQRAAAIGRNATELDVEHITWLTAISAREMAATDYADALATVHRMGRQLASFFDKCDVFLAPTLCLPPLKLGELDMMTDDVDTYLAKIFAYGPGTSMFNMSGQPSMSVPLAWSKSGLPLSIMSTGGTKQPSFAWPVNWTKKDPGGREFHLCVPKASASLVGRLCFSASIRLS
jgi:amidase/6-aminohexanoate-cyclic-dimer hydrolase